jgi:hypothetical protein
LPDSLLKISSVRSQTTVRFSVAQRILEEKQLRSVSLGLDRMVTLVPEPDKKDLAPQTAGDISHAVAGVRRIGKMWETGNADNMIIARLTDRIVNVLSDNTDEIPDIGQVMLAAVADEPTASKAAVDSARRLLAVCQRRSRFSKLQGCLEEFHDQIMLGLNGKFWSALIPGS